MTSTTTRVTVSLGSNIEAERNITGALAALEQAFGSLTVSPVYESKAVGFEGENFLNLVAAFDTSLHLDEVAARLTEIETEAGRTPEQQGFSPRPLDLDILTFGSFVGQRNGVEVPRPDMLDCAFVLKPLADLLPEVRHPGLGRTYAELWRDFSRKEDQPLWRAAIDGDLQRPGLGSAARA